MSSSLIENAPLANVVGAKASSRVQTSEPRRAELATLSPWKWCLIACLFLLVSGGIRFARDFQFKSVYQESESCPFPLADIPKDLGRWHAVEGSETKLDPEIARVAGSTDHFIREYSDRKTGEKISVFVLYGPATKVFGHTPAVCYPAAGYQTMQNLADGETQLLDRATPLRFTTGYFGRNVAGVSEHNEAVWTFRQNGIWKGDMSDRWKTFRYHPGMFKIQLHRPVMSSSSDRPTESLLKELATDIENRVAASQFSKAQGTAATQPLPKPTRG